ncbi:MAG: hypothetical protein AAFX05_12105 [Planctomycetota bacterium]
MSTDYETQQWLVLLTPSRESFPADATPSELAAVGEHFAMLQRERDAGRLVLAGRSQDAHPIGIVILEGMSRGDVERLMESDAGVRAGVFRYELRPYSVALLRE